MYVIELKHKELNKYRVIRGKDYYVVQQKAKMQRREWNTAWEKKKVAMAKQVEKENEAKEKEEKRALAQQLTLEAEAQIGQIEHLLIDGLKRNTCIDWEKLKDNSPFKKDKPVFPAKLALPLEPRRNDETYNVKLSLFDKLFPASKKKKLAIATVAYEHDHQTWLMKKKESSQQYDEALSIYGTRIMQWDKKKEAYETEQVKKNQAIDQQKESYLSANLTAIMEYCDMVLSKSEYPHYVPKEFELDYIEETGILIVDYMLPPPVSVPSLKEVKYIQTRDELTEYSLSKVAFNALYDSLIYQISLRTIYELFNSDGINKISAVVFNGWVKSMDKSIGKEANACILSVHAQKEEFLEIHLANVDPKLCVKRLKGVGSSKLHSLTAIAPIININREDERFVSAYQIVDQIEEQNLAAMDWQDFEQLIREVFEKEFNQSGGEVKITRASKDGGVDAIAFDPDPIRGGKIVIQAKRYTNTVGVAAVRDLYGTVLNEGATKGILVSTADYGPDAYSFKKDKPLELFNGNNLLHLLQKHGHRARIDLKEAKKLLKGD